jgi:hypothetical protein
LAKLFFRHLQIRVNVIKFGMAEHQRQRFEIVTLVLQPGCHRAATRMAAAALSYSSELVKK